MKLKIYNCKDNYGMCGIVGKRVCLPDITNIISSIITIHELNHYVSLKNKSKYFSYMSLYDELIPMNSEFVFINKFYKEHIHDMKKLNLIV